MTTVTRIRLRSGDRDTLDSVVASIKERCRRKGAELKGPHTDTPSEYSVSLFKRLDGDPGARYPQWNYTVFQRRLELRGHDELAREILEANYPGRIQIEATVEQITTG